MYVCMYACMHACMYVCMYVCMTFDYLTSLQGQQGHFDFRTRTRTSTRFDCSFLAKILRKFISRTTNLTLCYQYRLLTFVLLVTEPFC